MIEIEPDTFASREWVLAHEEEQGAPMRTTERPIIGLFINNHHGTECCILCDELFESCGVDAAGLDEDGTPHLICEACVDEGPYRGLARAGRSLAFLYDQAPEHMEILVRILHRLNPDGRLLMEEERETLAELRRRGDELD